MGKRIRLITIVMAGVVGVAGWLVLARPVAAGTLRSGEQVSVRSGETVDGSLFSAGQTINVAGIVNGDVFCAGNSVTISGTVRGDVICAGETVTIAGIVEGDVRAAASNLTVNGAVGGNISAATNTFMLGNEANATDVSLAAATVVHNGTIRRDFDVASASVTIDGSVGRHLSAQVERLRVGSTGQVVGNLYYQSENELTRENGARLGTVRRESPPQQQQTDLTAFVRQVSLLAAITSFVLAMVLVMLVPRFFYSLSSNLVERPGLTALAGFVGLVGGLVVIGLLAITGLGFKLAVLAGLGYASAWLLSGPVFAFWLGRLLLQGQTDNALYYMLLGAGLLLLVAFVPPLAILVGLASLLLGSGMLALEVFRRFPRPRYNLHQPKTVYAKHKKGQL